MCSLLVGVLVGAMIAKLTPNPLFWIEDKYKEWRQRKHEKENQN